MLPADAGEVLLPLARAAIGTELGRPATGPTADWLAEPGASFVTLKLAGQLRGCIGSLEAFRPLGADVVGNAQRAAFRDPRFAPLREPEFDHITIEVSVLTEPQPMGFTDLPDALAQLRPGIDGVVLRRGALRATYLPQVWEQIREPAAFIRSLLAKAGLTGWDDRITLQRYRVQAWSESESGPLSTQGQQS